MNNFDQSTSAVYYLSIYNKAFFLHPFRKREYFNTIQEGHKIHGYYGGNFNKNMLPVFREELQVLLESYLKAWNEERSFIKSFLLAAATFLFFFVFLSIGIRDPIPIIDELLISGVAAITVFIWFTRRMFRSSSLDERRIVIQRSFDAMSFSPAAMLDHAQAILNDYTELLDNGSEDAVYQLLHEKSRSHDFSMFRQEQRFLGYLDSFFSARQYRPFIRTPAKLALFLRREWYRVKELKIPLYLFYIQLKKHAET